jgi:uroporphyrin-III C-methyltransferase / precorrin-2 dehydrogenase / sirohydrochlorin ferrochelatase
MSQLPIFVNLDGQPVILLGEGNAADAKRRFIERAGAVCVDEDNSEARLAFIAIEEQDIAEKAAARLKARGLLVNVVDQPDLCDFTTPAIIDRSPMLIAIGTGGASAGLAKAVRQRLERLLPATLGTLADALFQSRSQLKKQLSNPAARRRAIDAALDEGGPLDPFMPLASDAVSNWLAAPETPKANRVEHLTLCSNDPETLKIFEVRLLGQADCIYYDEGVAPAILVRARADAVRMKGPLPVPAPSGLTLYLSLQNCAALPKAEI